MKAPSSAVRFTEASKLLDYGFSTYTYKQFANAGDVLKNVEINKGVNSSLNLVYEETGDLALAAELANHKSTETTRSFYCRPKTKAEVMEKINALKNKNNSDLKEDESVSSAS